MGENVLRTAATILDEIDTLISTVKACADGETGRLAVGFCTSLSAGNLRATLLDFAQRYPEVKISTIERSRNRLSAALRSRTLDVLIVPDGEPSFSSSSLSLWSERIFVILPRDHTLAAGDVTYWTDLRSKTVLLSQYDPGREPEDLLNSKLIAAGERPVIQRHDVSRGIVKSLIAMRMGIGLALESDLGANFASLVYRELRDGTGPTRISFSAWWQKDNDNPALQNLLELFAERYPPPDACG